MDTNNTNQLFRKQGQTQVVDKMGNLQSFSGNLDTLPVYNNVITPQSLAPQPKIQLPQTPQPTTPTVSPAQNMVSDLIAQYDLSQTEKQAQNFQNQGLEQYLKDIVGLQGETQALATEKEKAGVGTLRQDLQNINSQILKKQAELQQDDIQLIANMRAEERRDTLLPFAQMGQAKIAGDAQIVRALKNAEIGVLNAQALAKQGDIALAQQTAEEAVAVKYAPYKERIQSYENIVKALQPFLTSAEKKEANKQKLKGDLAMREIEKEEQNEKDIQSIALKLAEFGQSPDIIKGARTPLEAISLAGSKLQDPKAKLEIQKLRNDIARQAQEARILAQYGGLTPEQWAKKQEEALKGLDATKRTAKDLENQKNQVETILNSKAINTVVGPTAISRSRGGRLTRAVLGAGAGAVAGLPFGGLGAIPGAIVGGIAGATLPGISDEVSGRADDLVALTEQMLSQQFLDKLIQVKGQGATFGALTDREGNSLRSAANAISQTAIRDKNDKVIGYDMSENEFRRQFGIMQEAIQLAEIENTGKVINDSEDADLENIWQTGGALVAPGNYYQ